MENEENISSTDSIKPEEKEISSKTKPKYSDEYLLNHLKELAKKLGRTPSVYDINNNGGINVSLYYKNFGSIIYAQKKAGLIPSKRGKAAKSGQIYSNDFLITYLKELAIKLGRTPSSLNINNNGEIKTYEFLKCFGKLSIAHKTAGLVPNTKGRIKKNQQEYSKESIITYIKELSLKLGKTPTMSDIKIDNKISMPQILKHFGKFSNAQEAAGLIPTLIAITNFYKQKYSKDFIIAYLKELSTKLGKTPTVSDVKIDNKVSRNQISKRFGSLNNAQKAAGLVPTGGSIFNKPRYSNEDLINHLKELAIKLGKTPSTNNINVEGKIKAKYIVKRFGKISKAHIAAGLIHTNEGIVYEPKYSNEELINHLKELAIKLGRTPTCKDINDGGKTKAKYFIKRFGKIRDAQGLAGLIPNKRGRK